jgi:membrane protease YdiL (CAAX protease family)
MNFANTFIPTPPKAIESFTRAVFPPGMTTAQLMFFLAVMPGIFEEITFRGLLLHGLRRRMSAAMCVLTVGLVFGFFHMALFRLAPTAFLGMLLAGATLLSGSIYPAMLWHASNNALGLIMAQTGMDVSNLDGPWLAAGPILLACAFWILWRERAK